MKNVRPAAAPAVSMSQSSGEACRPATNSWCTSSVAAYRDASASAAGARPTARYSRIARMAYSAKCASFRRTRSPVPRPVPRPGIDEKVKMTPAQKTTGSQRVARVAVTPARVTKVSWAGAW
jgi:hypothetical protein